MRPRQKTNQIQENNTFKLNFSSSKTVFDKINFTKTTSNINIPSNIQPTDEDIYYDEVVYYDGGGVEGYGY